MKVFGAVVVLGVGLLVHFSVSGPVTVEAASSAVRSLEGEVMESASMTRVVANHLADHLDEPATALRDELREFHRSTEHLRLLRDELGSEINGYQIAYNTKLAVFDQERAAITDPVTLRTMTTLRAHIAEEMSDRMTDARSTLDRLDTVLAQGADLEHATQCVIIADDLNNHGEDLDAQITAARTAANNYASTTSGLLATINKTLTQ